MKRIRTKSGADYLVYKNGMVKREPNDAEIAWTLNNYQYGDGFLDVLFNTYKTIAVSERIVWWGMVGDYAERIYSSLVETIQEEE